MDFSTAIDKLNSCKASGESEKLNVLFMELEVFAVEAEAWPDTFVRHVVGLLSDSRFLELKDSWQMVRFISNNWEQLSRDQQESLRSVLANSFDKYRDWMGAFVTAEILGERYGDEEALAALGRLSREAQTPARALVPHGLEALAKTTNEGAIRNKAVERLKELAGDNDESVGQEARISLQKLGEFGA